MAIERGLPDECTLSRRSRPTRARCAHSNAAKRQAPSAQAQKGQILLAADAGLDDEAIAATVVVGGSTVYRTKRRFVDIGLEAALSEEPRPLEAVDIKDVTPASCQDVISVAASDRRGHLAPYSNYGMVTVMAPGGDLQRDDDADGSPDGVWSLVAPSATYPSGVAAYEGTSMAAPHVSAAIAMAITNDAGLRDNPQAIAALLTNSVAPLPTDACSTPCGPRLLDAAAMTTLLPTAGSVSQ